MTEFSEISQWVPKQHKWLQFAAIRCLGKDDITNEDISEFSELCKREAKDQLSQFNYTFPNDAFATDSGETIRLCSLSEIEGVNALAPRKPLEFGKNNITVIYGLNGSGKSGYVRLLKHMCSARNPGTLHRNIYSPSPAVQKATITFEKSNVLISHNWTSQLTIDELKQVNIFDSSFGRVFMEKEDEVCYEPPVLSYLSLLISICEKVGKILDDETTTHPSKKPNMPTELKSTAESSWFDSITHTTSTADIEKYCTVADNDKEKINELQLRLAEQAPLDKAAQRRKQKGHLDALLIDAQKHLDQLSDKNCQQIITLKQNAVLQKKCADVASQKIFKEEHLKDIGSDIWKELWAAAQKYSTLAAYKDQNYPNVSENARCVLCQQLLSDEAKARLSSFNEFVKDEMQNASLKAASEFNGAIDALYDIPSLDLLKIRMEAGGINQAKTFESLNNLFTSLKQRKDSLLKIETIDDLPPITYDIEWVDSIKKLSAELIVQAENYDKDALSNNHFALKGNLNSLQAKKWLSDHRKEIESEVERLGLLNQIQKAKKLTNTKSLSLKKGELAETLITEEFTKRFNAELQNLKAGYVKVELIKSNVSKGRVLHKIRLSNAFDGPLTDILSEGENKIVSIAAFFADVGGTSNKTPLIFDDPISSLDQNFEEAFVHRLTELSTDKQILIFTHRLSLLSTIKHFSEKKSIPVDFVSIRSFEWGTGEPAPIPLSQREISATLNVLINERIPEAKKAYDQADFEKAESDIKAICSEFRILIERVIENDLLCGVVQRHQRPVHTIKIINLQKINAADCEMLHSLMIKYSGFEHSQSSESPIELPNINQLCDDLLTLKDWREEFAKRTIT